MGNTVTSSLNLCTCCICDGCDTTTDTTPILRDTDLSQTEGENSNVNAEPLADAYKKENYKSLRNSKMRTSYWWELINLLKIVHHSELFMDSGI